MVFILKYFEKRKPRRKLAELSAKAKYYLATDSEPVPRGKGEKQPGEGDEIKPETIDFQRDGARKGDVVLFGERANEFTPKASLSSTERRRRETES